MQPRALGRSRSAGIAIAAAMAMLLGALASPVWSQAGPTQPSEERAEQILEETLALAPESPPAADDPFQALHEREAERDQAALDRMDATNASEAANVASLDAALARNDAQAVFDAATRRRDSAVRKLAKERKRMSDLTVRAYVSGGSLSLDEYRAYVNGDTTDPDAGREMMFNQVLQRQEEVTDAAVRSLAKARAALEVARGELAAATELAEQRATIATDLAQQRAEAEAKHERSIVGVETARDRLRAAGRGGFGVVPGETPLIGLPRLSAEDLSSWFATSGYRPRVSTPISDYARWFIDEGAAEGIRGDIAFAQAVLETGGFANNDSVNANNFSGIGHCDTCGSGWSFPSPQAGVRAQIQLLKSYAIRGPHYVHPLVDKRLRGPAGCCQTWLDLTTVWATDPTYGPKVMLIYSDIVTHALARRAAGQGFDDPPPGPTE